MAAPRQDLTGVIQDLSGGGSDMMCGGMTCPFGCALTPSPHCKTLQPSGVVTAGDYGASGLTMGMPASDVTFNTDTGQITGGITRAAGPGVAGGVGFRVATQGTTNSVGIFSFAGFKLPAGTTMKFTGSGAFAMASSGDVSIAGTIRAGCSSATPGPGGSGGGTINVASGLGNGIGGGTGGGAMGGGAAGGGGGGYGDVGGTGAAGQGTPAAAAGSIWPLIAPSGTLILVGGSGGGAGGGNGGGAGGGGGGAVQLSVNGTITVTGIIDVSGCGGGKTTNNNSGGGGGGAGGAIVLEAGSVMVSSSATLSSNGGGGGGGGDNNNSGNGSDGAPGATQASGGAAGGGMGGGGGAGGARGAQAGVGNTQGTNAPQAGAIKFGGGGGGGTGRILLRALSVKDQAMVISPDPADLNRDNQHMTVYDSATFQ